MKFIRHSFPRRVASSFPVLVSTVLILGALALTGIVPPEVQAQTWKERAILEASNRDGGDTFGERDEVAIDGNRAIVGATGEDGTTGSDTDDRGAAYILERQPNGSWTEVALLRASDADPDDNFGDAVAISGDWAIVGTPEPNGPSNNSSQAGAAYLFERQSDGSWTETQVVHGPDETDLLGASVAIDGDRAVIGVPGDDGSMNNSTNVGAAYVYELQSDGSWAQTRTLRASNAGEQDSFGESAAIDGNRAVIGTSDEDGNTGDQFDNRGAAYVFDRQSDGSWVEVTLLRASNADSGDEFGEAVSVSGDRLIVGASGESGSSNNSADAGAAYVFERQSDGSWAEVQLLRASSADAGDRFGRSVAIDGGQAIVGAPLDDATDPTDFEDNHGAAYIFERQSDGSWPGTETQLIRSSDILSGDNFGDAVAISADRTIVGAPGTTSSSGSAYVFVRNPPTISTNQGLSLDEGATTGITSSRLEVTDGQSGASNITYTITSNVSNGEILLFSGGSGTPLSQGDTFTQTDINNFDVAYQHDGSETTADAFDFSAKDGDGKTVSGTFSISVALVADLAITDGGGSNLDFSASISPGTDDNPVGLFQLSADESGATFEELTVTNGSPGVSGITKAHLFRSTDQTFDAGDDTKIASFDVSDNSAEQTFTFDGFSRSVPEFGGYYFLTIDVTSDASSGDIQFTIADGFDLTVSSSDLATVNGQAKDNFASLPLSNGSVPLPVELAAFDAERDERTVRLTWTTASETNNAGFRIQRRTGTANGEANSNSGEASRRDASTRTKDWQTVGTVDGAGTTSEAQSYRFTDGDLPYAADRLSYRLKQVDTDGSASYSETVTVERGVREVQLLGTAPNPAREQATVRYALPDHQETTIRLYDVLGRQVRTVVNTTKEGRHERTLDVSGLSSGVYFLRLRSAGTVKTQKLTVVR